MRFGAVLHDAGSSNLILGYLDDVKFQIDIVLLGPSKNIPIYQHKNFHFLPIEEFTNKNYDVIFFSLNEYSVIDKKLFAHFRDTSTLMITFLDHWSFTTREFQLENMQILPDLFVVTDQEAKFRAELEFPNTPIILLPNYFLDIFKERFFALRKASIVSNKILFLSEKVNKDKNPKFARLYQCGKNCNLEFHAYEFFLECLKLLGIENPRIVIRPHPSQSRDDFGDDYFRPNYNISFSQETDLLQDLLDTRIVIGIHSMAMLIASHVGIQAFTCLPPGSGDIAIPGDKILYLRDLVS